MTAESAVAARALRGKAAQFTKRRCGEVRRARQAEKNMAENRRNGHTDGFISLVGTDLRRAFPADVNGQVQT